MKKNGDLKSHFTKIHDENHEKYVKEMHDLADKSAKKVNLIFASVAIPVFVIVVFVVVQFSSFSFKLAKNDSKPTITTDSKDKVSNHQKEIYEKVANYLDKKDNRSKSLHESISMNKGESKGITALFIAQILRNNKVDIPKSTISTKGLVKELENIGWTKITDIKQLEKGDICFTTADSNNVPSHTYIFMGWIKDGKTNYANVVDSQISEYNSTLHKRNIDFATPKKDKFKFFMRKPSKN